MTMIRKLSEVKRGKVGPYALTGLNHGLSGLFVTAVSDADNNLLIFVWANAEKEPRVAAKAGGVRAVAAASLADKRFITAVRDSDDRLRVTAWSVSEDGRDITRLSTETGPTILDVTAASTSTGAVIAARRPDGRLYVTGAGLDGNRLVLNDGETFQGKAENLALAPGISNMLVMRDSDGRLRITQFLTTGSPHYRIERGGTSSGGAISQDNVRGRVVDAGGQDAGITGRWVTFSRGPGPVGVRTGLHGLPGRLLIGAGMGKLIAWEKDTPAMAAPFERGAERELTGEDGIVQWVALEVLHPLSGFEFVTGHLGFGTWRKVRRRNQGKPRLELNLWRLGETFQKLATARLAGDYSDLDIAMIARRDDDARFVVALRGDDGELKVTVWAVDRV